MKRYLSAVEEASWAAAERSAAEGHESLSDWRAVDERAWILIDELEKRSLPDILAQAMSEAAGDEEARARVAFLATGMEYLRRYGELARAKSAGEKDRFEALRRDLVGFVRAESARDPVAVFPAQLGEVNVPFMRSNAK